jgi:hypothetical protein
MDDEQPSFKVTDRRLFNADGSPRDLPAEEPKPEPAMPEPAAPEAAESPAIIAAEESTAAAVEEPTEEASVSDEEEFNEEELEGAHDPTSFVNFLMSIASNAASALGMMEHPVTHKREVDLELGKHWIDILGMLQQKTSGNLSKQEVQMLEGLLADLRMQYVSLANTVQRPQAFSGKDITGGK